MGGGKVISNDEKPPPQKKEGETKKYNLHSLKVGDKQQAVHMQIVAGGEHGQSDRSKYSSWMDTGLPKKRKRV